jgi:hypothetical protein
LDQRAADRTRISTAASLSRSSSSTVDVELYDGRSWRTAHAGDFLFVPEGGVHGFRGVGPASMLLLFAPGAPREEYFETLAKAAEQPMSEEERAAFMDRHDTYWV